MLDWNWEPTQIQRSGTPSPTTAPRTRTPIRVSVLENPCLRAMSERIEAAEDSQADSARRSVPKAVLTSPLPDPLELGGGTALRLEGTFEGTSSPPERLSVRLGSLVREVDAFGMPEPRSYGPGSRWWVILPVPASTDLGTAPLALIATGADGEAEFPLGELRVVRKREEPGPAVIEPSGPTASEQLIAICMATHEPPAEWLRRQLDSIRAQGWTNWVCLISDDGSSPEAFAVLEREVGDDARFVVSRSSERLGFYGNFERALRMIPPEAELIGFADQDDRWDPDKLEAMVEVLGSNPGAALAYSDMRVVDEAGDILSDTFWYLHQNAFDDIASLAVNNTVTGAASLFRRELLEIGLPFPPRHSDQHYHDHWLALCALAIGDIAYLDRPTYDYTRHVDSVTVQAAFEWYAPAHGFRAQLRQRWRRMTRRLRMGTARPGWRAIYFDRYLLFRQLFAILELRAGERIEPRKRRSLQLLVSAESSPRAAAWLLARTLRPLIGRRETQGRERVLLGGLLWRRVIGRRARAGSERRRSPASRRATDT